MADLNSIAQLLSGLYPTTTNKMADLSAPQGKIAPQGWQEQYAYPDWQSRLTKLNPQEEQQFQQWWAQTGKGRPLTDDYDMRGFWKNGGETGISPIDGQVHFTDQWKTPLHHSFSSESVFVDPKRRMLAPYWSQQPNSFGNLINPMNGAQVLNERLALARALMARRGGM